MNKWLFYRQKTETVGIVTLIYHVEPPKELTEQLNYLVVEDLIEPEEIEGKQPVLCCNPKTNEVWYEYVDRPLTPEEQQQEKIQTLEQSIAELTAMIAMLQTPTE